MGGQRGAVVAVIATKGGKGWRADGGRGAWAGLLKPRAKVSREGT